MRTFIDVGSHEGQTLEALSGYDFDLVYGIEPMPNQFAVLQERFGNDPAVRLLNVALSDHTGPDLMFGTNDDLEASLYRDKEDVNPAFITAVSALRATELLATIPPGYVYMKLNCEGAEVNILNDLAESGGIRRITRALVDFDIEKVPGHEQDRERTLERMAAAGFDRFDSWPEGDTHQYRIRLWLDACLEET